MYSKLKSAVIGLQLVLLLGCATKFTPLSRPIPAPPKIRLVEVKENCVCGASLDALTDNWLDALAYIEILKTAGCFK